jgi:hypothetical protein
LRRSGVVCRKSERESHDRNAYFGTDNPSSQDNDRREVGPKKVKKHLRGILAFILAQGYEAAQSNAALVYENHTLRALGKTAYTQSICPFKAD